VTSHAHLTSSILLKLSQEIGQIQPSKRKEEELKLVLNWAFEVLEERISTANHSAVRPEEQFISYYFKSVSCKTGLSIRRFLRPSQTNPSKGGPRSFNANFLHSISQSKAFTRDFGRLLEDEYLEAMQKIMHGRLLEMAKRWQESLKSDQGVDPTIVCDQLNCSRKLKMPWSDKEVLHAKETALQALRINPRVSDTGS
jgi:hypothetical protein